MGSGKTTLGKKLARRMGMNFIDLDEFIEKKEGKSLPKIFATDGEKAFRQMEAENLRLLENIPASIISLGGGAPCFHDNMSWMNQNGLTVYLKQTPEFLYSRLKSSKGKRPLISGLSKKELLDYINEKLEERSQFYEKARIIIESKNMKARLLEEKIRLFIEKQT
jgi:shikimate kinase